MSDGVWLKSAEEQRLVTLCFAYSLLCFAVQCSSLGPFWFFRNRYFIFNRWSSFEIALITVMAMTYTLSRFVTLWTFFLKSGRAFSKLTVKQDLLKLTEVAVSMGPMSGMICLLCTRAWHQYYSAMVAVKIGLAEWRSILDDSLVTEDMSWFLRNKHTWGNRLFVGRIATVIWIALVITAVCLPYVPNLQTHSKLYLLQCSLNSCIH